MGNPLVPDQETQTISPTTTGLREKWAKTWLKFNHPGIAGVHSAPRCSSSLFVGPVDPPAKQRNHVFTIAVIKRGVLLPPQQMELPCPPSLVFIARDDIRTDLSGLVLQDEALAPLAEHGLELLREGLQYCCDHKDELPSSAESDPRTWLAAGAGLLVALASCVVLPVTVTTLLPLVLLGPATGLFVENLWHGAERQSVTSRLLYQDILALSKQLRLGRAPRPLPRLPPRGARATRRRTSLQRMRRPLA